MILRNTRLVLSALAVIAGLAASQAHAQAYQNVYRRLHIGTVDLGATGQFSTLLTQNPSNGTAFYTVGRQTTLNPTVVSNQQQYTTTSTGFLASFGLQPFKGLGVELNYGFTHYSERYAFNYAITPVTQTASVPTDQHEFTGAYMVHPKHIPFQPFVGIGGGAIDFAPRNASNQWRGAGLLETGFDIRTRNPHLSFRVEGSTLR